MRKEPRIVDPVTHPVDAVSKAVACDYMRCDLRALDSWIRAGRLKVEQRGRRVKVFVTSLVGLKAEQLQAARLARST